MAFGGSAFSEGGLGCEDTFTRILYYTERRKSGYVPPQPGSAPAFETPWYELHNPEAHGSLRARNWPPPHATEDARDSYDDMWSQRPFVMPLASTMDQSSMSHSLSVVRNARSLGDLTLPPAERPRLPPLKRGGGGGGSITREGSQQEDDQDDQNHLNNGDAETDRVKNDSHQHVPDNFFQVPEPQDERTDVCEKEEEEEEEQKRIAARELAASEEKMLYFGANGLPMTSKLISSSSSASSSVQFERAPRRPHLYALMDLSHENHRERIHSKWDVIKQSFRARPPHGVHVANELLPMLVEECHVPLTTEQLTSLLRQLPTELRSANAYITYYEFLEYFGSLQKDGTVIEPDPSSSMKRGKEEKEEWEEEENEELEKEEKKRSNGIHTTTTPALHIPLHSGATSLSNKEMVVSGEEEINNNVELTTVAATRHSTRIAMEWDTFKGDNEMEDDNNNKEEDDDNSTATTTTETGGAGGGEEFHVSSSKHHIDQSLDEVRHLSACVVQSVMRGVLSRKRERIRKAMALCLRHEYAMLRTVVKTWGAHTSRLWLLRSNCSRPLHQWRRYCRRLREHRFIFRCTFWPFYIWRKYSGGEVYIKHKVRNLVEIFHTSIVLRSFRKWHKWWEIRVERRRISVARCLHMERYKMKRALVNYWHGWASKRSLMLKKWRERGSHLAAQNHRARRLTWFAMWRYHTYLRLVTRERSHMYWLFPDKPKCKHFYVDENGVIDPTKHSIDEKDEKFRRILEPLLTIDRACLSTVESGGGGGGSSSDRDQRRIIPHSVLTLLREKGLPSLASANRVDRNGLAVSYFRLLRLGPIFLKRMKAHVIRRRKKRYCRARGLQRIQRISLFALRDACRREKRQRMKAGLPILALQTEEEKKSKLEKEERRKKIQKEGNEGKRKRKKKGEKEEEDDNENQLEGEVRQVQVVHTLEARNRRRERKIEEAKKEFEDDVERRRNGLRYNENLQKEMKEMASTVTLLSNDTALHHEISFEAVAAQREIRKKIKQSEVERTQKKRKYVLDHMASVRRKRGRMIHDVMCKVIDEVSLKYTRDLAIQCIRRLRIHAVSANSEQIFNRARLKNWMKICTRLRRLDQGMHHYRSYRVKYHVLNQWMWLLRKRYQYGTKGLDKVVERRRELLCRFSVVCLDDPMYCAGKGARNREEQLLHMNSDLGATFLRWVEYTQEKKTRKFIIHLLDERRRTRTLQKVFFNMSMSIKSTYTLQVRRRTRKFLQLRVDHDLDLWRQRLLVATARRNSRWTRRKHLYVTSKIKFQARSGDSFKRMSREWTVEIEKRTRLEQRLLFLEFQKRGQRPTEDLALVPSKNGMGFGELASPEPSIVAAELDSGGGDSGGVSGVHQEQSQLSEAPSSTDAHHVERFTDADLPFGSVLERVTVHVDGWIVGLEVTTSWKVIDRAASKSSPKKSGGGGRGGRPVKLGYFTKEKTVLHGKATAKAHTFVLDTSSSSAQAREKCVALEGFAGDVVGRLRFITDRGRRSPWYGQVAIGDHFILMGDTRRTPDDSEIVGFHGVCDHDGMRKVGVLVRYTLEAPLFSNCWTEYAKIKKLEEEEERHPENSQSMYGREDDHSRNVGVEKGAAGEKGGKGGEKEDEEEEEVSQDESQFAAVLRMRNCDILQALEKAQLFVRRLRRHPSVPSGLQPLKIALALGAWYFESLTHGLVPSKGADVNQGERLVGQGESLLRKGERVVDQGERMLHDIAEYRIDGKHALRPAVTGRAYVDQVKTKIAEGETVVQQGEEIKQSGATMLARGLELMPQIPKRRSLKRYFEAKIKLATFQSGVPVEMFEVNEHDLHAGASNTEETEKEATELMQTAADHKKKSTAVSTEAFMQLM